VSVSRVARERHKAHTGIGRSHESDRHEEQHNTNDSHEIPTTTQTMLLLLLMLMMMIDRVRDLLFDGRAKQRASECSGG